jgi:hypothetical protein
MLPKIANVIAEIFKTVSPIIEAAVDAISDMVPKFQQAVGSITGYLGEVTSGIKEVLGVAQAGKSGPKTSQTASILGQILYVLSGMYIIYKASSLGASLAKNMDKGWKFLKGAWNFRNKTIQNATLAELENTIAGGIRKTQKPSQMSMFGGPLGGILMTLMAGGAGMKLMGWISDKIMGETKYSDLIDKDKVFTDEASWAKNAIRGGMEKTGMYTGIAGINFLKNPTLFKEGFKGGQAMTENVSTALKLQSETKIVENALRRGKVLEKASEISSTKIIKNLGGFTKVVGKLAVGLGFALDVHGLATAETRAERWASAASLITTGLGAAIGTGVGAGTGSLAMGVGALPGAGAGFMTGASIGQAIGIPISMLFGSIGGYLDKQETLERIKEDNSFKIVEQFKDVADSIKDKGSYTTDFEKRLGKNFDYSKNWDENMTLLQSERDKEGIRIASLKNYGSISDMFGDSSEKRFKKEYATALMEAKLARKQFEILKLKDAYNRDDKKNIEEQLKILKKKSDVLLISNEELEKLKTISSEARVTDYSKQMNTGTYTNSLVDAWKRQDFESLTILAETLFKKLKRKISEGLSKLGWIGKSILGEENINAIQKSVIEDVGYNHMKINELVDQIKQKGGKITSKVDISTQEKQEDYIIALTSQLGKLNKTMKEQTKAVKDQTGATKENTEAVKEKNEPEQKSGSFSDLLSNWGSGTYLFEK